MRLKDDVKRDYSASEWYIKGDEYFQKGEFDKAIECYNSAIGIMPDFAKAYYAKGVALCKKKPRSDEPIALYDRFMEIRQATTMFQKAIEIKPDFVDAYYRKAIAQGGEGFYQEAIDSLNKAIKMSPSLANACYVKGLMLGKLAMDTEAAHEFGRAIDLEPELIEAHYNKGIALHLSGKSDNLQEQKQTPGNMLRANDAYPTNKVMPKWYDEAMSCFDYAIEHKYALADVFYNKGLALASVNQYEDAIRAFDSAIALNNAKGFQAVLCKNKGVALYKEGHLEEALSMYAYTIGLSPSYTEALFFMALVLTELGRVEEARTILDRLQICSPCFGNADMLGSYLDKLEDSRKHEEIHFLRQTFLGQWFDKPYYLDGLVITMTGVHII